MLAVNLFNPLGPTPANIEPRPSVHTVISEKQPVAATMVEPVTVAAAVPVAAASIDFSAPNGGYPAPFGQIARASLPQRRGRRSLVPAPLMIPLDTGDSDSEPGSPPPATASSETLPMPWASASRSPSSLAPTHSTTYSVPETPPHGDAQALPPVPKVPSRWEMRRASEQSNLASPCDSDASRPASPRGMPPAPLYSLQRLKNGPSPSVSRTAPLTPRRRRTGSSVTNDGVDTLPPLPSMSSPPGSPRTHRLQRSGTQRSTNSTHSALSVESAAAELEDWLLRASAPANVMSAGMQARNRVKQLRGGQRASVPVPAESSSHSQTHIHDVPPVPAIPALTGPDSAYTYTNGHRTRTASLPNPELRAVNLTAPLVPRRNPSGPGFARAAVCADAGSSRGSSRAGSFATAPTSPAFTPAHRASLPSPTKHSPVRPPRPPSPGLSPIIPPNFGRMVSLPPALSPRHKRPSGTLTPPVEPAPTRLQRASVVPADYENFPLPPRSRPAADVPVDITPERNTPTHSACPSIITAITAPAAAPAPPPGGIPPLNLSGLLRGSTSSSGTQSAAQTPALSPASPRVHASPSLSDRPDTPVCPSVRTVSTVEEADSDEDDTPGGYYDDLEELQERAAVQATKKEKKGSRGTIKRKGLLARLGAKDRETKMGPVGGLGAVV